jgi:uncharacterized protein YqiB (DUF1249 family)
MANKNSSEDIHTRIYRRLLDVIPDLLTIEEHGKSEVDGLMSLNFDVVQRTPEKLTIALSHYYKHHSGDMIPDPDMMVAVYIDRGMAEALTYQDMYIFTTVYSQDRTHVDVAAKRSLNSFLNTWLGNLIEQGHIIKADAGHG